MLYQNFTTKNIDFILRFFGYENMQDFLLDQEDALRYEAATACYYDEPVEWLPTSSRQMRNRRVDLYMPTGSENGPWNIRVKSDQPETDPWSNSDQVHFPITKRCKLPNHVGKKLFRFGESLTEPFYKNGTSHMKLELSQTRTVYADLYGDKSGSPVVVFELVDHVEYEGPEIPLELEEDIPF